MEEILQTKINDKSDLDICVWKSNPKGKFTTAYAERRFKKHKTFSYGMIGSGTKLYQRKSPFAPRELGLTALQWMRKCKRKGYHLLLLMNVATQK